MKIGDRLAQSLIGAVLGLAGAALHARHFLNSDEGVILAGAWRIINGQSPYLDFFAFIPPGSFYAVAWAWMLGGPTFAIAKALGIAALCAIAAALWRIGRSLRVRPERLAIIIIAVLAASAGWPLINHNTFALPFCLWSAWLVGTGLERRRHSLIAAGGVLAGLAGLFLLHTAMAAGVGLSLAILYYQAGWRDRVRALAAFGLSGLLPLILLPACWPIRLLATDLIAFPAANYHETNRLPYYLFALAAIALAAAYWRVRRDRSVWPGVLALTSACLLAMSLARPDLYHLSLALIPALPLAGTLKSGPLSVSRLSLAAWAAFGSLALVTTAANLAYFPIGYNEFKNSFWSEVRNRCPDGRPIYAGPFLPGLYYELRRPNPSAFDFLIERQHTPAQFDQALVELTAAEPVCGLTYYAMTDKFGYRRDNPVDRWLAGNYIPTISYGDFQLWEKSPGDRPHRLAD